MIYVTDLNEIFKELNRCCGKSKNIIIGTDEQGCQVSVPMFTIGDNESGTADPEREAKQYEV